MSEFNVGDKVYEKGDCEPYDTGTIVYIKDNSAWVQWVDLTINFKRDEVVRTALLAKIPNPEEQKLLDAIKLVQDHCFKSECQKCVLWGSCFIESKPCCKISDIPSQWRVKEKS